MNKYTLLPFLKIIQRILTKINNLNKYFKAHALPSKNFSVYGFSTETSNLPNCYQRFKEEEMDRCYNTFKAHFYNAVFLDQKELISYSIKEALENDDEKSDFYYLEFGVGAGGSINFLSKLVEKRKNLSMDLTHLLDLKKIGKDMFSILKEV